MSERKKLVIAAHLEMCKGCNFHGEIVYSDESRSGPLWSQQEAMTEVERAWKADLLMSVEIVELHRQIAERLPPQEVADTLFGAAEEEILRLLEEEKAEILRLLEEELEESEDGSEDFETIHLTAPTPDVGTRSATTDV